MSLLDRLGGVADRGTLVRHCGRAAVDRALVHGAVVRVGRGRYALPGVDDALRAAHGLSGALSHTSAALALGWAVKSAPDLPHVTVPRKRHVRGSPPVHLHRFDLGPDDVQDGATSPELTLLHCARTLPFDEGLAVADSALRGGLPSHVLAGVATTVRGAGAARVRRVCAEATGLAANPFESVLRAICLEVPGLAVAPQVWLSESIRPDLVDRRLGLVVEADSFEFHGKRHQLRADMHRSNRLGLDGWLVLHFSWEDVMFDPGYVRTSLATAVAQRQAEVSPRPRPPRRDAVA